MTSTDDDDAELARRVSAGLSAILGRRIHLAWRAPSDEYGLLLAIAPTETAPPVLSLSVRGEIFITSGEMINEESDDLEPDEDRAAWAVKIVADLARFGAARIRPNRLVPRSWSRLVIFESTERRNATLALADGRVVSTFPPFALAPIDDDVPEVRARLGRGESVFVQILDGEFPGARLYLVPLELEAGRRLIEIDVEAGFEEGLLLDSGAVLELDDAAFDDILGGRRLRLLGRDDAQPIVRELWGASRRAWGDAVTRAPADDRSTPDAGGTILRGSNDTNDDSREPT
jgi:hypothetical protein